MGYANSFHIQTIHDSDINTLIRTKNPRNSSRGITNIPITNLPYSCSCSYLYKMRTSYLCFSHIFIAFTSSRVSFLSSPVSRVLFPVFDDVLLYVFNPFKIMGRSKRKQCRNWRIFIGHWLSVTRLYYYSLEYRDMPKIIQGFELRHII
jgi:hypothetical protein